ncbi:hypothetical protein FSARC_7586 [Fusarium sarcochroum]|uniref:Oxidoreductase acuF-like C2H2 type zinc-finger domain-containing protein n=1 Tax=Fusarium sarcochroum TaxID=1208366 RepID=A0A8H4TV45_9HYPO|nr:hypothetical protein FSARC_7586 [Fusarium sarcochroum]
MWRNKDSITPDPGSDQEFQRVRDFFKEAWLVYDITAQLEQRAAELEDFKFDLLQFIPIGRGKHTAFVSEERLSCVQTRLIRANLTRRNRFDIYFRQCLDEAPNPVSSANLLLIILDKKRLNNPEENYPECPAVEDTPFRCPYCAQILDPSYSSSKNTKKWRAHLAEDLSPYECIYAHCTRPDAMYSTVDVWKKHLRDYHGNVSWLCDTCWLIADDPSAFTFPTKESYHAHLRANHDDEFNLKDLPLMTKIGQITIVPPVKCPLCPHDIPLLHPETDKHLAEHLHAFALKALLRRTNIEIVRPENELEPSIDATVDVSSSKHDVDSKPGTTVSSPLGSRGPHPAGSIAGSQASDLCARSGPIHECYSASSISARPSTASRLPPTPSERPNGENDPGAFNPHFQFLTAKGAWTVPAPPDDPIAQEVDAAWKEGAQLKHWMKHDVPKYK